MTAAKRGVDSHARELARAYIKKHHVRNPPILVFELAKAEGLTIVFRNWGAASSLDALLLRSHRMIAINANKARVRQRFSAAHELGHYALNHDYHRSFGDDVDIDHPPEGIHILGGPFEAEANEFASELLIPREFLIKFRSKRDEGGDADESFRPFAELAKKFRGSQLSAKELATKFEVSEDAMFIALQRHQLL